MSTSALVIVLEDPGASVPVELTRVEGLTLGPPAAAGRVPAVLEAADADEGDRLFRSLQQLPGVAHVEVAFVGFCDEELPPPPADRRDAASDTHEGIPS